VREDLKGGHVRQVHTGGVTCIMVCVCVNKEASSPSTVHLPPSTYTPPKIWRSAKNAATLLSVWSANGCALLRRLFHLQGVEG